MLLSANALDKQPIFFDSFKDIQSEDSTFTPEICKDWNEVHWYQCGWYLDCPKSKTPHSELEWRNHLGPTFVQSIVEVDFPRSTPIKGKRKNNIQMPEQSKDNSVMNDEPSGKKLKVLKSSTLSSTNLILSTILEPFIYLRIKTKVSQTTQCNYENESFELIFNDSFFNILNLKEKTEFWP